MRGILRRNHEKGLGQGARFPLGGDLVLLHRLEKRALGAWGRAVDFVSQHHIGEYRAGVEIEATGIAVVDRNAEDVGRQQVAGELDALEAQSECGCNRMRQRGFPDAGQVLDQQMPAGKQAGQCKTDLPALAEDDASICPAMALISAWLNWTGLSM